MLFFSFTRKQRQVSAPSRVEQNPELEQLKQDIENKKHQRLFKQQQTRDTLASLNVRSVPSTGRAATFVCFFFVLYFNTFSSCFFF